VIRFSSDQSGILLYRINAPHKKRLADIASPELFMLNGINYNE